MAFTPFNHDENSLERGDPISNATKPVAKAVSAQAAQQAKAAKDELSKQIVGFLYGDVPASAEGDSTQTDFAVQQLAQGQKQSSVPTAHVSVSSNSSLTPEQTKLAETREKLSSLQSGPASVNRTGLHKNQEPAPLRRLDYYEETFGDAARKRREQEAKQKLEQKTKEEEEKKQAEDAEKERSDEEVVAQTNRPTQKGRNRMGKKPNIALTKAKTKTEINRGASG